MDKTQLALKIQSLDGLTREEKDALLKLLRETPKYGLVWEDKPEAVEERLRDELPVLIEDESKRICPPQLSTDNQEVNNPNHIIIEGDNLEALTALSYTHAGKIDVIYIDPPYNTGNKDFVYNDSYVDSEDTYRHSKWLSFMSKRLRIAKKLLSDRGVIFISIDDNEQANLKLLCDEVFGERNFICSFIWRGGKRNMAKWVSTSHEYMLTYAFSLQKCNDLGVEWHEKKRGIEDIYKIAEKLVAQCGGDYDKASELLKKWFKALPEDNPSKDHKHYCHIDRRGVYFASDISRGGGGGPKWTIVNPYTGQIVKTPSRGWAYPSVEALQEDIDNEMVHFNGDGVPCKKRYLKDNETQILETVFYKDRRASSKRLRDLLGDDLFPFPKDEEILAQKIDSFSTKESVILDFFAGSGTTMHAVMQLNAEDGGKRTCILCTNNENGICENVTYERNKRVIEGYTKPNGEHVEGLHHNNLRYYRTAYVGRSRTMRNMRRLMDLSTDMLCIKEDLYAEKQEFAGLRTHKGLFRFFDDSNRQMLVIYREEAVAVLVSRIAETHYPAPIKVYVFSPSEDPWEGDFEDVAQKVKLCALPQAIYNTYKRILPKPNDRADVPDDNSENQENLGGIFDTTQKGGEA